jgi:hypothetical protein
MKRKLVGAAILFLVLIFAMVSCKSTDPVVEDVPVPPPVETPTPVTPPPVETPESLSQDMINALNEAKSLAATNRTYSMEVDGPKYFPDEWEALESQYVEANGSTPAETDSAYQTATNTYKQIAADFEGITSDALPLYAEELRGNIIAARTAAIDAGIVDISPERFIVAEDYAVSAQAAWEIGAYEPAIINARNALPRYQTLKTGADAYDVRMEIDYWIGQAIEYEAYNASIGIEYGDYSSYETALNSADETAFLAINQYDADNMAALATAEKALSQYNTLTTQAWSQAATIAGNVAVKARKTATDAKAPVAAKPEFDRAENVYTAGQTSLNSKDTQKAAASYYQSIPMFNSVAELAEYKRQQALAAIDEAERKIAESDQTAGDAEVILGGGVQ